MIRLTSGVAFAGALVLGLTTVGGGTTAAEAAGPTALVPHEATYDMQLGSSRSGSGVVGARGTMNYSFTDTCDGYAVNTRTVLSISYGMGAPVVSAWDFSTWESKDGTQYRFKVRNSRNGVVVDTIDGRADMPEDGSPGAATFTEPEGQVMALIPGTLFPTEHTRLLLDRAAGSGSMLVNRPVFDGSSDHGVYEVSALIGLLTPAVAAAGPEKAAAGTPTDRIAKALLEGPSWPMTMAFFPLDSNDLMPEFQVGLQYHDNGVAENVVQDFGDFTINGTMTDLKPIAGPDC